MPLIVHWPDKIKGGRVDHSLLPLFYDWRDGSAIQTDRWKLVRLEDEWELYDRQADRTETTNLAGQHPDIVDQLQTRWQEWVEVMGPED